MQRLLTSAIKHAALAGAVFYPRPGPPIISSILPRMRQVRQAASLAICLFFTASSHAERFTFVALGDTAYDEARDQPIYEALIDTATLTSSSLTVRSSNHRVSSSCHGTRTLRDWRYSERRKSVQVSVDTDTPWLFGFEPLYNE